MQLDDDIRSLKGVGEVSAQQFGLLGIAKIGELIDYYPRKYDDFSVISDINRLKPGPVTIRAIIQNAKGRYARRGLHIKLWLPTQLGVSVWSGSTSLTGLRPLKLVRSISYQVILNLPINSLPS